MKPGPLKLAPSGGLYQANGTSMPPHEHRGHRWAMVIDLQRCIGCQACAVACYAENNLSVVGQAPDRNGRGRWPGCALSRIGTRRNPSRIAWLPMLCQHCDCGALRAGLPGLRRRQQRGGPERPDLQPLHRDALLLQQLPLQGPAFQLAEHAWRSRSIGSSIRR